MAYTKKDSGSTIKGALCPGSTCAFLRRAMEEHLSPKGWSLCWKCHGSLGCLKCAASTVQEVLCERCLVWGTVEALVHHGPVANVSAQMAKRYGRKAPRLEEYPSQWQGVYRSSGLDFREELFGHAPCTERGRAAVLCLFDIFKRGESLPEESVLLHVLSQSEQREEHVT